jgi:hypothetical protein
MALCKRIPRLRVLHTSVAYQVAPDALWTASLTKLAYRIVLNGHHLGHDFRRVTSDKTHIEHNETALD